MHHMNFYYNMFLHSWYPDNNLFVSRQLTIIFSQTIFWHLDVNQVSICLKYNVNNENIYFPVYHNLSNKGWRMG